MSIKTFYTGIGDVNLAKDVIAKQPDLYIQKYEYIGSGVGADATLDFELTPAVSPAWTVNEFASTVAKNILIVDSNGKVCAVKCKSNTASKIVFVKADALLEEDVTTAGTFTTTNTFQFYVLSPSSVTGNTYGNFAGFVEGLELTMNEEWMSYKYGMPKKLMFKDLAERAGALNGGTVNFTNEDMLSSVLNASSYGLQTSQFSFGIGSDPVTSNYYRLTFMGQDRAGRAVTIIVRKAQLALNGSLLQKAESGHYMLSFSAEIQSDGFYPDTADMMQIIRAD